MFGLSSSSDWASNPEDGCGAASNQPIYIGRTGPDRQPVSSIFWPSPGILGINRMQNFVFTYLIAHFPVLLGLHLESEGFVWANPPVIVYMSAGKRGRGGHP